jgi:hypothetical protein
MKNLTMILILAIAFVVSSGTTNAQEAADLRLGMDAYGAPSNSPANTPLRFDIQVFIGQRQQATGATLTAELPEGVTVVEVKHDKGACASANNHIVCTFPQLGRRGAMYFDWVASIQVYVARPQTSGLVTLSASITATETDPNPADNSKSVLLEVIGFPSPPKSRKRTRFYL